MTRTEKKNYFKKALIVTPAKRITNLYFVLTAIFN